MLYKRGRTTLIQTSGRAETKKGIEAMMLWITLSESIFKKRGQARQERMNTWLTETTPEKMWKDRLKADDSASNLMEGRKRTSRPQEGVI